MSDAVFLPDRFLEGHDLEAKLAQGRDGRGALPQSFWETYSAFANTGGGYVFLGVRELSPVEFEAAGLADADKVEDDLWNQLNNPDRVSCNLLQRNHVQRQKLPDGKEVLIIEIPRADRTTRPVYIGKDFYSGTYKRNKSGDYRCTKEEVERMLAERVEESRDTRLLSNYDFADLSVDSLNAYRQRLSALKPDHPFNDLAPREFLRAVGARGRNRDNGEEGLTLAGLLMFGTSLAIREVLPHYFLDYREIPMGGSKTEWTDRLTPDGTWSGNLYDFYRQVISRLFRDLKVPLNIAGDQRRDDTPLHRALRESLVNALVHADYSDRASVLVVKAPDYFGFRNPGHMRIAIRDALEGGKSDCRNRTLQTMFSLIGLGEQAGSGIPRILKNWDQLSYRQPELWEDSTPDCTMMRLRTVSLLPEESLKELGVIFGPEFEQLDGTEKLTLVTAHVEDSVSNQRLQQVCRDHPQEITKMLQGLVQKGFLESHGVGRATTYALSQDGANDTTSPENDTTSGISDTTSPEKDTTSTEGIEEEISPELWERLLKLAEPIRESGRPAKERVQACLLELCRERYLTKNQLGELLNRDPLALRRNYLGPMQSAGVLEYRFPKTPNHENQAYRAKLGSADEK